MPHNRLAELQTYYLICLGFSGRGPEGEAVIQLSFAKKACAVKWGVLSKLSKTVFQSEIKKAVQQVFPGAIIPEPLDMVFKYWEKVAW